VKVLALILGLLALSLPAHSEDALKTLRSVSHFAFGGVGAAGTVSEGEVAFREVLKRASAKEDFSAVLKSGTPQAKCYALVALRSLDPQIYSVHIEKFKKDKTDVTTIGGCIIMVLPMSSVVGNIEAGNYDRYVGKQKK
jgi:hypothetical protein